ncbi:MAG: hypothetical protein NC310_06015 [Roseburia sp.]|nr:hypothetical protein [Anaeroplasma bactoclasticum]MCM1196606.1 hypothetical protein [Roseburia sp.]MCM1557247.1 hypothetical protein [Anaeroplasma bactoclasticum]
MLKYYYTKEKNRLYVYDSESGFFSRFDEYKKKWVIPFSSFSQIDHDNDDLTVISEESAKKITSGVSFNEEYKAFLLALNVGKLSSSS